MTEVSRDAIFISHANPEDNAFTVWRGARLTAAGYEVGGLRLACMSSVSSPRKDRLENPPRFWFVVIPEEVYALGRPQSKVPTSGSTP